MAARNTPAKGSKPDKLMRNALMLALHEEAANADGKMTKKLRQVADALVNAAIAGDISAIKEINDRIDGKVTQPIAGDSEADPIRNEHTVNLSGLPDEDLAKLCEIADRARA